MLFLISCRFSFSLSRVHLLFRWVDTVSCCMSRLKHPCIYRNVIYVLCDCPCLYNRGMFNMWWIVPFSDLACAQQQLTENAILSSLVQNIANNGLWGLLAVHEKKDKVFRSVGWLNKNAPCLFWDCIAVSRPALGGKGKMSLKRAFIFGYFPDYKITKLSSEKPTWTGDRLREPVIVYVNRWSSTWTGDRLREPVIVYVNRWSSG